MPYKNEHAARQESPSAFVAFRRKAWGKGISAIFGIPARGSIRVQALRFDAKRWTVKQAQAWLQAHDFRTDIEPATATRAHASDRAHVRDLRERLRARIEQAKRSS